MRTVLSLSLIGALGALLACGGTQKTDDGIEQEPVTFEDPPGGDGDGDGDGAQEANHLKVVEMKITDGSNEILIKADGSVIAQGNKVGTVTPKGEMLHVNGAVLATLNKDGTITGGHVKTEEFAGILIGDDGVLKKNDTALMDIGEDGSVTRAGKQFFTFEGDSAGRRAAMFVIVIATMPQKMPDPPPDATEKTPETTPEGAEGTEPKVAPEKK